MKRVLAILATLVAMVSQPVLARSPGYHIVDRIPLTDGWWDYVSFEPVHRRFYNVPGGGGQRGQHRGQHQQRGQRPHPNGPAGGTGHKVVHQPLPCYQKRQVVEVDAVAALPYPLHGRMPEPQATTTGPAPQQPANRYETGQGQPRVLNQLGCRHPRAGTCGHAAGSFTR